MTKDSCVVCRHDRCSSTTQRPVADVSPRIMQIEWHMANDRDAFALPTVPTTYFGTEEHTDHVFTD